MDKFNRGFPTRETSELTICDRGHAPDVGSAPALDHPDSNEITRIKEKITTFGSEMSDFELKIYICMYSSHITKTQDDEK